MRRDIWQLVVSQCQQPYKTTSYRMTVDADPPQAAFRGLFAIPARRQDCPSLSSQTGRDPPTARSASALPDPSATDLSRPARSGISRPRLISSCCSPSAVPSPYFEDQIAFVSSDNLEILPSGDLRKLAKSSFQGGSRLGLKAEYGADRRVPVASP